MQIYVAAAGPTSSAQAPDTAEITCIAHKTWGHRAIIHMGRIDAVGWPWCVDGTGNRYAQVVMATININPSSPRTTEAPLTRVVGLTPMVELLEIKIAATTSLENEVLTAITRAQMAAHRCGMAFKWTTSQLRMSRAAGGCHPGAPQMAIHQIEIRSGQYGVGTTEECSRAVIVLKSEITDIQNDNAANQTRATIIDLANGHAIPSEWCVAWTKDEINQAVHVPMNRNQTYNALMGMQRLADRFGAKAVPVDTGVAVIGCAPAVVDAVLQGWPQHEGRTHQPRRISTYITHSHLESDVRLSAPAAGHDLAWMIATEGQVHPTAVAMAMREVLGEFPAVEPVCAFNPMKRMFEQMVQTTVPTHLRQRMLMGPGAEGSILVGERRCRVYPFTEVKQPGRHRAIDDTQATRLLEEALRSRPSPNPGTTIFAQTGTMDIHADEIGDARTVPVMIPLGGGMWNSMRNNSGDTPAAYTMPSLGTHLALALRANQQLEPGGIGIEEANEALRTARASMTANSGEEEAMDVHCQFEHGLGNVRIALAPGDIIVTTVVNGGTIQIRSACESMQVPLTHHARVAIHHPVQANMRAARHTIDPTVQIEFELVVGTVWLYQRRRQGNNVREPRTNRQSCDGARPDNREAETDGAAAPNTRDVPMEEPIHRPHDGLDGTLRQLRHVAWENSDEDTATIDHNPAAANNATQASREILASFGTGATEAMIRAYAAWIARHVRARQATSAPNHWCWALTTVCWLISKAMQHDGSTHGLSCRAMASNFGMNAAGIRQRPLSAWIAAGTRCDYNFAPGTLPPGAQSTGENESVVSHTNTRLSGEAARYLDRLIQIIWTEGEVDQTTTNDSSTCPGAQDTEMDEPNALPHRSSTHGTAVPEGIGTTVADEDRHTDTINRAHRNHEHEATINPECAEHEPSDTVNNEGQQCRSADLDTTTGCVDQGNAPTAGDGYTACNQVASTQPAGDSATSQGDPHPNTQPTSGHCNDPNDDRNLQTTSDDELLGRNHTTPCELAGSPRLADSSGSIHAGASRDEEISPTIPFNGHNYPEGQWPDASCQPELSTHPQPSRRSLTGERAEPIARRMRTDEPMQHEEQAEATNASWGLGPRSARERWNTCDQYIRTHGHTATRSGLRSALIETGCPEHIAELAIQTWLQAGLLLDGGTHIRAGPPETREGMRVLDPPHPQSDQLSGLNEGTRVIALLSLFDGTGLARIAIDEAIGDCGGITLAQSAFVEHDTQLSRQVATVWNREVDHGRTTVPHVPIASDIWDLCRSELCPLGTTNYNGNQQDNLVTPLSRFAQTLPDGCITIIIAGSPCQQLTYAGRYRGGQGLCGPDSVLFFAVPTVAWILQELRPDINVQVVLENAGSMQSIHRATIMQALGGLNASQHLRTLDSGEWSVFPRRRYYFMTLPENGDIATPTRREAPWEPGWGPIPAAVLHPMMCSRNNTTPRASTNQYHAQSLIYRYAEGNEDFDWHGRPETHVRNQIIRTMPNEIRHLYRKLLQGQMTFNDERSMGPVIDWIHQEGPRLGYRIPTTAERVRATGRARYLNALELSDVQLHNAVGNHFDPDALRARMRGPLSREARSGSDRRHQYPTPADLAVMYQLVANEVAGTGIPVAPTPFPPDLTRTLTATVSSNTPPTQVGGQTLAAEDGRHNQ